MIHPIKILITCDNCHARLEQDLREIATDTSDPIYAIPGKVEGAARREGWCFNGLDGPHHFCSEHCREGWEHVPEGQSADDSMTRRCHHDT